VDFYGVGFGEELRFVGRGEAGVVECFGVEEDEVSESEA